MKSLRRAELWAALVVFVLLAALSILGAFGGADRAGAMFTSVPLALFWIFFVVLVLAGIVTFPRLRRAPALLVVHLGFAMVVAGGFWSSQTGHRLAAALTGRPKIIAGYMGLHEGQASSTVMADAELKVPVGEEVLWNGDGSWIPHEGDSGVGGNVHWTDIRGNGWDDADEIWADTTMRVQGDTPGVYDGIQEEHVYAGADGWTTRDGTRGIAGNLLFRDANANGVYDAGESIWADDEPVIGRIPPGGATGARSARLLFNDANNSGRWDRGEDVWIDANGNGVYDEESHIYEGANGRWDTPPGTAGVKEDTPTVVFHDTNGDGKFEWNEGVWIDANHNGRFDVAKLPFGIYLERFEVEHYPAEGPWDLVAEVPRPAGHPAGQGQGVAQVQVEWKLQKMVRIPFTDATVTVLQYLPSARAKYAEGAPPVVEVATAGGEVKDLPATPGASVSLGEPPVTVRVVKVFANLRVLGSGDQTQVVDVPGPAQNPAVQVNIEKADGTSQRRFVSPLMPVHGQEGDELSLHYRPPELIGAEPAPDALPAMQVRVQRGDSEMTRWFAASEGTMLAGNGAHFVFMSLGDLFAAPSDAPAEPDQPAAETGLYMVERLGQVKDWKSTVSVMEEGQRVLTRVVEVNHPLHYGGYRFYQFSVRPDDPTFTELSVASDSGVWLIYLGFICVGGAAFWWMWLQPVWERVRARRKVPNGQ